MKEAEMTAQRLREIVDYCPDTGLFVWRVRRGSRAPAGGTAGHSHLSGRIVVKIERLYYAHRLAWLWMTGRWPESSVDHIDGNALNNRWANLREATHAQNMQNMRKARSDSTSGLAGAMWHPKRACWYAQIRLSGKKRHLGYFKSKEAAHAAYLAEKRKVHPFATI